MHLRHRDAPAVALATAATAAYSVYSLVRHSRYESEAFDMGIYDQVVWYWSRLKLPANTIQGFPQELGDHFSPVYALLAPGHWLQSGPSTALIAQAVLIGISIVAVHRAASRRVAPREAYAITIGYALFWGVWSAVDFDFHETAFAAPLIAWAVDAADTQRWRRCAACLVGLVLVKEDMGLVVAAFGIWLATQGSRRAALAAFAGGVVAFVVVNGLVMPAINGGDVSATDNRLYGELGSGPLDVARQVITHPASTLDLLMQPADKPRILLLTFGAFLFLGLLSPLTLVALPQLLERLLTSDPHYWVPQFHYTLAIAPILAIGAADGLGRLRRMLDGTGMGRAVATACALGVVVLAVGSAASGPPKRLFQPSFYERTADDRARDAAVAVIPDGEPVAADETLLPHVSSRRQVYQLGGAGKSKARWLIFESTRAEQLPGWRLVFRRRDVVVYRRF